MSNAVPTIATRLTAEIPAAIATIALRGPQACETANRFLQLRSPQSLAESRIGQIRYGTWRLSDRSVDPVGEQTNEQVVVCRVSEDVLEVHCHGGNAVCQCILNDLAAAGCMVVPQRVWPSALSCPTARAAEQDLLAATSDRAASILLDQMSGTLAEAISIILQQIAAAKELEAQDGLRTLLRWSDFGMHLSQPWKVVLAGPPNVGKSSLMNAIAGMPHSIVHHEPGTTRDWVEYRGAIEGWPIAFTDTAGVRESQDKLEQAAMGMSLSRLREADLAVLVVDASLGWDAVHEQLLGLAPSRRLIAWNKIDLVRAQESGPMANILFSMPLIPTCAVAAAGVTDLLAAIADLLVPQLPAAGTAVVFRQDQVNAIESSLRAITESRLDEAQRLLRALID